MPTPRMTAIMTSPIPPTLTSSLVTPVPSSASSVASASGSGSDSDVSSLLMANTGFNAQAQMYMNANPYGNLNPAGVAASLGAPQLVSTSAVNAATTPHHPIAEFLYQLTKMLTDDNAETIEWTGGRIHVHDPQRLADEVLDKYFRHSKYASFQRQLNYFGFRKIAGKGKMSPCSYVNDAATDDIRSLLFIKRKTNGAKKAAAAATGGEGRSRTTTNPIIPISAGTKRKAEDTVLTAGSKRRMAENVSLLAPVVPQSSQLAANAKAAQQSMAANAALMQAMANSAGMQAKSINECLHLPNESTLSSLSRAGAGGQQQLFDEKALSSLASQQQQALMSTMAMPNNSMPCPATAAMNAAAAAAANQSSSNLFESSTNLSSLLTANNDSLGNASRGGGPGPASASAGNGQQLASSSFLSSLPSSNTLFPDSLSNISLNRMMQAQSRSGAGTKRIPSLLGMNNFLSRESSLVDLAMLPSISSAHQLQSLGIYSEPTPIQEMN